MLQRHFLRAQMLLHGDGEVRSALHRRVVGDDQRFAAMNAADTGDQPGRGRVPAVHAVRGQRRKLEERAARVEQRLNALPRQQLAARGVLAPGVFPAAERCRFQLLAQVRRERGHALVIGAETIARRIDFGLDAGHEGAAV